MQLMIEGTESGCKNACGCVHSLAVIRTSHSHSVMGLAPLVRLLNSKKNSGVVVKDRVRMVFNLLLDAKQQIVRDRMFRVGVTAC